MSSRAATHPEQAADLSLQELLAIKPSHLRGKLGPGNRMPDGERPGRGRAHSLDFDGLSPYVAGDDVRAIDWRATMRTGETTVRRFAAASHRARVLVLQIDPDLHFGTADRTMAKTACLTAAWLAWMSLALHEPVALQAPGTDMPARRGRRHVLRLLDALVSAFEATRSTAIAMPDYETAAACIGRQDELCVISEMPVHLDRMISAGRALRATRQLRLLLVEDQITRQPPAPGRYPLRGPDGIRQVHEIRADQMPDRSSERRLMDAGWHVERALDLLPGRAR